MIRRCDPPDFTAVQFDLGATDFLAKPLDPVEIILRVENLLTGRALFRQCQVYSHGLERLVDQRTDQLQRHTVDLEKAIKELRETQQQVIQQKNNDKMPPIMLMIASDELAGGRMP